MNDADLAKLIGSLSLRQKAALCSGADFWTTKPIPSKGIPSLRMADGPHGLRYEDKQNARENGAPSRRATCFPPEVALACSFSPQLARRVGHAIAEECEAAGVHMILGPGVNVKRSPLGGRNFEYYSEDPLLTGEMAAGFIEGVQEKGVATCLKHYAVNNQEIYRMSVSAAVDERALFDIYLRAFEIAVKKASPASIMASYNKVDGTYATEHRRLLTDILRLRFGFTGAVVSDWSAVADRPAGVAAGLDLEMPASGSVNDLAIEEAVNRGELSIDALDTACWNVLRLVYGWHRPDGTLPACDYENHHALAAEALAKSAVLLKNDGMLPLATKEPLVVIGEMAGGPHFQGGGSSVINPVNLVSFIRALNNEGIPHVYKHGYKGIKPNQRLIDEAVQAARGAETVLLFLGLPDVYECEGYDRETLSLPGNQLALLDAVAAANANVCVVLSSGAPVEVGWLHRVRALLCLHLGGEALGEAALRLLLGRDNPSGKLAESWPAALADTPCHYAFPMGPNEVRYRESIFVGYRYYDTAGVPVQFPFGYGLSYTSYEYSDLRLEKDSLVKGEACRLSFTLANTGPVDGEEIIQVYAARRNSAAFQPAHELVTFTRVTLKAGESARVELEVPYEHFAFHDAASGRHVVEAGEVELQVGASSRDLPLRKTLTLAGERLSPTTAASIHGPYGDVKDNSFPEDAFTALLGKGPTDNTPPRKGEFGWHTPVGLMRHGPWGWVTYLVGLLVSRIVVHFSHEKEANRHAADRLARDLPFKNAVITSSGIISPRAAEELLALCNGKFNALPFIYHFLIKRPPYKNIAKHLDEDAP